MKDLRNEYLPGEDETPPTAALKKGGNGEEKQNEGFKPETYSRILFDERVPHGAFRFWHYIVTMCRSTGRCWPGNDTIARRIHCDHESLKGWRKKLVACGYLTVELITQQNRPGPKTHGGFFYRLANGDGVDGGGIPVRETPHGYSRTGKPARVNPRGKVSAEKPARGRPHKSYYSSTSPPKSPSGGLAETSALREVERSAAGTQGESESGLPSSPDATSEALKEGKAAIVWTKKRARHVLTKVKAELEALRADKRNYEPRLKPSVEKSIADLQRRALERDNFRKGAGDENRRMAEQLSRAPQSFTRGDLLPAVQARVDLLSSECDLLRDYLAGERELP